MGVVISNQMQKASLFVDKELEGCYPIFTGKNNSMDNFVRYIKDGCWIEDLSNSTYFSSRQHCGKGVIFTVTFYSVGLLGSFGKETFLSLHGSGSIRSSSVSTRDSYQASVENFSEFYVNVEEKTCFKGDEMMAFLVSIVYPFFLQSGSRKGLTSREVSADFESLTVSGDGATGDDEDLGHLQEILLSTAAFFDDSDLRKTLSSRDWMTTLCRAVDDSALEVCICAVDSAHTFPPVLINSAARKRLSVLNKSSKHHELDFLQVWSIEYEDILHKDVLRSLAFAEPMRLQGAQCFSDRSRTILDVTPIFDDQGVHRFVLGVQMNVPLEGRSSQHLQYLHNTSLLVAHLIKTSAPSPSCDNSFSN